MRCFRPLKKIEPDPGPQAAAGTLDVCILSHGRRVSLWVCVQQWRPVTGIRLVAWKGTASVAKASGFVGRSYHWVLRLFLLCGCYWYPLLFFLVSVSTHLSFAGLCAVQPKWDLCVVPERLGKLIVHPVHLAQQGELFLAQEFSF